MAVVPHAERSSWSSGNVGAALGKEVTTVLKAAKRVAAMATVDASISVPQAKPLCDAALTALCPETSAGVEFLAYRPSQRQSALLVLCHPSEGASLSRALFDMWSEELTHVGIEVRCLDIGGEDTSSMGLSNQEELKAALAKASSAERIQEMQKMIEESRFLIFVHPIFWFDVPSQLKGFLESVLSAGFAYRKLPSCWTLNRAVDILERLPVLPRLLRRYSAYGFLRDKQVWITRTMGGPVAGPRLFGHSASTLESTLLFVGAQIRAVDTIGEIDDASPQSIKDVDLPSMRIRIAAHCKQMAATAAASAVQAKLALVTDELPQVGALANAMAG